MAQQLMWAVQSPVDALSFKMVIFLISPKKQKKTWHIEQLESLHVAGGADFKSPSRTDSMRAFDETDFLTLKLNGQVSTMVKRSYSQSLDHRAFL